MENLTLNTFKEKVCDYTSEPEWKFKGLKPAIIDFYAEWCGPCKMLSPILEELSTEYPDIDFYKIDCDAESQLAQDFGVKSIPTIFFVPVNELPQIAVGGVPKQTIKDAIKDIFGL